MLDIGSGSGLLAMMAVANNQSAARLLNEHDEPLLAGSGRGI